MLPLNHISTEVFLCAFGGIIFPSPRGLLGKFLCAHKSWREGGTQMLSDKQGHTGSWLCACLIVLEALICQGSAGNQVGLYSTTLCLLAGQFHVCAKRTSSPFRKMRCEDKTISCLCRSAWGWAHPSYLLILPSFSVRVTEQQPSSKTNLKYAFSHANTRMFGNFSPRVVGTSGFASCQRSANNKTEATSKIIKASFLRTSTVLQFQSGDMEDAETKKS